MFQTKVAKKIKTNFMIHNVPHPTPLTKKNSCPFML